MKVFLICNDQGSVIEVTEAPSFEEAYDSNITEPLGENNGQFLVELDDMDIRVINEYSGGNTKERVELQEIWDKVDAVYDRMDEIRNLTSQDEVADIISDCEDDMVNLLSSVESLIEEL